MWATGKGTREKNPWVATGGPAVARSRSAARDRSRAGARVWRARAVVPGSGADRGAAGRPQAELGPQPLQDEGAVHRELLRLQKRREAAGAGGQSGTQSLRSRPSVLLRLPRAVGGGA